MADVQTADGAVQGGEATDSGSDLYDLGSVDPEIREHLAPHLKAVQSNVEKKFREAADYRKGWEPYEELGLRDMEPEAVKQLLDFAQLANDPAQFDEWLKTAAEERGLLNGNGSSDDLTLEDIEELTPEKVKELVEEQTAPIQQTLQQQQQEQAVEKAEGEVKSALRGIRDENPDLPDGAEDAIEKLAYVYSDDAKMSIEELIAKGFEDYQSLVGQGEKGLFEQKAKQPAPAEGPGAAAMGDEKITSFDDPRLRQRVLSKLEHTS